jgi:ATP-binding cassette subfamily F protein 3
MLLSVRKLSLAYGPKTLFDDASLQLHPRSRVALVGPNGSGKSTLLKLILNLGEADAIEIDRRKDSRLGYLPQDGIVLENNSVVEEVERAAGNIQLLQHQLELTGEELLSLDAETPAYRECLDRYTHCTQQLEALEAHKLRSKAEKILFGLGFSSRSLQQPCKTFSGGWQMRIALARLLLEEPDLLMMDEPTNHLDLDSIRWLEGFLRSYPGALLLISHDQALIDQLCDEVLSIESSQIIHYTGNYSAFLDQQQQRREMLETTKKSQDRKIAQTERFIERFRSKASKATQVQSRIKQLDKVVRIETEASAKTIQFVFPLSRKGGHTVIETNRLDKSYGDLEVLRHLSFKLEKGDRVGVVGVNGAGKSTLTRLLANREKPTAGTINLGYQIDVGYFAQDQTNEFDPQQSVLEIASNVAHLHSPTHVRSILGAFLFAESDWNKPVHILSGGEKNRLALARLLLQPSNFLILDEPTNHLDIASKAVLQRALMAYQGTYLIVSHDRHFLNPIVNRILEIQPGKSRLFPGNLNDYLWKIDQERVHTAESLARKNTHALNPKERRRLQAQRLARIAPLKEQLQTLERTIDETEKKIATMEAEMTHKAFFEQGQTTSENLRTYDLLKSALQSTLADWESAAAALEALQSGES